MTSEQFIELMKLLEEIKSIILFFFGSWVGWVLIDKILDSIKDKK